MKNLLLVGTLFFIAAVGPVFGQDYQARFKEAFDKRDQRAQEKVLKEWEKAKPDDAELFVSYFNYYFAKGRQETLTVGTERPNGESVAMTKTDDPKVKAYIGSDVTYVKADVEAGLTWIDKGISKYPDRLDMRCGKIYALGQIGDFDRFTDEAIKTVDRSALNKNSWLWLLGKPLEKPREKMLSNIQDYVGQLYDSVDDPSANIRKIAEAVLKLYPDNVENLNNLAISYLLKKDYDGALVPLLKAEKITPADPVVLANIANCYFQKHDKANAVKYYELFRTNGDESAKQDADAKLKEIKKW